jgi:hypothetical protein
MNELTPTEHVRRSFESVRHAASETAGQVSEYWPAIAAAILMFAMQLAIVEYHASIRWVGVYEFGLAAVGALASLFVYHLVVGWWR